MSTSGGVSTNQGAGNQLPPGYAGKGGEAGRTGHRGKAGKSGKAGASGQAKAADNVGRGFSNSNTVSHKEGRTRAHGTARSERTVRLPTPTVDPARVATPEMQAKIAQTLNTTEMLFTFDELLNQLNAESEELESGETQGASTVYGGGRKKKASQQQGGDSGGGNSGGRQSPPELTKAQGSDKSDRTAAAKKQGSVNVDPAVSSAVNSAATTLAQRTDPQTLAKLQEQALDVFDKVLAIESAPPELMAEIKAATDKLGQAILTGDVEDIARMLMEVQTKLQDTRIKFDEQAIRTSRLKRSMVHKSRVDKLSTALEKMEKAKKVGLLGKIFAGIATALAVVVAAAAIATGVGAKAGIMLIMASTIMVTMTISQNTGDWMTNMGGLIKDDKGQLAMGIMWAILAAALSFGAGFAGSAAKTTTDTATTTVQQASQATSQAAQQSANAAAQTAQQGANAGANAASQSAQQAAQQTTTAVQNSAKAATKVAQKTADEAAQQTAKVAVKSSQEAAKEAAKSSANAAAKESAKQTAKTTGETAAKEATKSTANTASKETAKQTAEITKKTMYFKRAGHIARFTEGAAMAGDGGATMHAAKLTGDAGKYQADAQEDLAYITKLQLMMEDWMEAIQRTIQEISEGQQIASDMLSQAQQSKFNVTRNI